MDAGESMVSIGDIDGTSGLKSGIKEDQFRDISFSEIMKYYDPIMYAVGGFVASVIASLNLPMFGFVLSEYIFVLGKPIDTVEDREEFIR